MKKLLFLLIISATLFSCKVTFVPTKSQTALDMVQKIQQDANTAFYIAAYNDAAYSVVNDGIDSLISFDKNRAKIGVILRQDYIIQDKLKSYQSEHKNKGSISTSEQRVYQSYFKSVIDARIISENSLK